MITVPLWFLILLCVAPWLIAPLLMWIAGRPQQALANLVNQINQNQRDDMRILTSSVSDMIDRLDSERARNQADRMIMKQIMSDVRGLGETDRKQTRAIGDLAKAVKQWSAQ